MGGGGGTWYNSLCIYINYINRRIMQYFYGEGSNGVELNTIYKLVKLIFIIYYILAMPDFMKKMHKAALLRQNTVK